MNNIEISEMLILLHEDNMFLASMLLPLFSQNEKVSKELQTTYSTLMSKYKAITSGILSDPIKETN